MARIACGLYVLRQCQGDRAAFGWVSQHAHRLWLAHYNAHPKVQKSWEKYWLWQYADRTSGLEPNTVQGIPGDAEGNLDCNAYDGTREQLKAAWAS